MSKRKQENSDSFVAPKDDDEECEAQEEGEDEEEEDDDEEDEEDDNDSEEEYNALKPKGNNNNKTTRKSERPKGEGKTSYIKGLLEQAQQTMINNNIIYDMKYFTADMDDTTRLYHFVYIMHIGNPASMKREDMPRKSAGVSFGLCDTDSNGIERMQDNNSKTPRIADGKKKAGRGKWMLCMQIFIPPEFRQVCSSWVLQNYGFAGHGFAGKIKRAYEMIQLFNFRYYIIPEHQKIINTIVPLTGTYNHSVNLFYPKKK